MSRVIKSNMIISRLGGEASYPIQDAIEASVLHELDMIGGIVQASQYLMNYNMRNLYKKGEDGTFVYGLPEGSLGSGYVLKEDEVKLFTAVTNNIPSNRVVIDSMRAYKESNYDPRHWCYTHWCQEVIFQGTGIIEHHQEPIRGSSVFTKRTSPILVPPSTDPVGFWSKLVDDVSYNSVNFPFRYRVETLSFDPSTNTTVSVGLSNYRYTDAIGVQDNPDHWIYEYKWHDTLFDDEVNYGVLNVVEHNVPDAEPTIGGTPIGEYYPIIPLRENSIWFTDGTTEAEKDHWDSVSKTFQTIRFGTPDLLIDSLKESETESQNQNDDVSIEFEDVYIVSAVDVYSQDNDDNEYMYKFFEFLHNSGLVDNTSTGRYDGHWNNFVIEESTFKLLYGFNSIEYEVVNNNIPPEGSPWLYTHSYNNYVPPANIYHEDPDDGSGIQDLYYQTDIVFIRHSDTTGVTRRITVNGLTMTHYTSPDDSHIRVNKFEVNETNEIAWLEAQAAIKENQDNGVVEGETGYVEPPENRSIILPIIREVITDLNYRQQHFVFYNSIHICVHTTATYYRSIWDTVLGIISFVIQIASLYYTITSLGITGLLAGSVSTTSAVVSLVVNLGLQKIYAIGMEWLVKELSDTEFGRYLLYAYAIYTGFDSLKLSDTLMGGANDLMKIVSAVTDIKLRIDGTTETVTLYESTEEFESRLDSQDDIQDNMDNPIDSVLQADIQPDIPLLSYPLDDDVDFSTLNSDIV